MPIEAHVILFKLKQTEKKSGPRVELIAVRNDQNLIHMLNIK